MRRLRPLFLLSLFAVLWTAKPAQAQSVTWNGLIDSTFTMYCAPPVQVDLNGWGTATGVNPNTDSIQVFIGFGDGTDTTFMTPLYGTSAPYSFYIWVPHVYSQAGTYTVTGIATEPGGVGDTISTNPIVISTGCGTVEGYTYVDNNSDCQFNSGDDTLKWRPLYVRDASTGDTLLHTWSGYDGFYSATIRAGINVEVLPGTNSGLSVVCPPSGMIAVNLTAGQTVVQDFGHECSSSQFDLYTHGSAFGIVPGSQGYVYAGAGNYTCLPTSGTITLTLDPLVSYVGHGGYGVPPTSSTANTVTWNIPSLANTSYNWYWSQFFSNIEIETDTTAVVGDTVCFSLSITPTSGDIDVSNNVYNFCAPVLASYDPNMKAVSPMGETAMGNVDPGTEFTYTVHFQNTGNYPAQNIYILDTLSSYLDLSTLEILSSSHNMNPLDLGNGVFKFEFNNIWLADSVSNEPESHGQFTYRVKAGSNAVVGTQVENTAHIYFDYNEAIVTNTTLNTIAIISGIEEYGAKSVSLYPNPARNLLNVEFNESTAGTVSIYDMTGRIVTSVPVNGMLSTIDVSHMNSGYYLVTFEGQPLGKVVVNR